LNRSIALVDAHSRDGQEATGGCGCDFAGRFGRGFSADFARGGGSFGPKKRSTADVRFQFERSRSSIEMSGETPVSPQHSITIASRSMGDRPRPAITGPRLTSGC
jgi:hypothetical protein